MFSRLLSRISSHFAAPSTAEPSTLCIRHEDLATDDIFNVHRIKGDRATIFAELVDNILTCGGSQLVPKPLRGSYEDDGSRKTTNGTRAWSRKGNSVFRARVGDKTLLFDTVDLDPVTFENGRYPVDPSRRKIRLTGLRTSSGSHFVAAQPDVRHGKEWKHYDRSSIVIYGMSDDEYRTLILKPILEPGTLDPVLDPKHNTPSFDWRSSTWDKNPSITEKGIFESPELYAKRIVPEVARQSSQRDAAAPTAGPATTQPHSLLD